MRGSSNEARPSTQAAQRDATSQEVVEHSGLDRVSRVAGKAIRGQLRSLSAADLFAQVANSGPDPILLLGAGASIKSGIPTSADIVRLAIRWLCARRNGWHPDDPRITPSDIERLLQEQVWYQPEGDLGDYFPHVMELMDQPRELRRAFLLHLVSQATDPSPGYICLATALRRRWIHTILTTNFDDLLRVAYGPGVLITVAKPDEYSAISTAPRYPQIIYLHGRAEYYMDRSLRSEVDHLDRALVDRLLPIMRDHPLIVLGYRGAEPSIMRDLLIDNIARAEGFKHGIYWCLHGHGTVDSQSTHPLVQELADNLQRNFTLVPNQDFDGLLSELLRLWSDRLGLTGPTNTRRSASNVSQTVDSRLLPFDLQVPSVVDADAINWPVVKNHLQAYAARMHRALPVDAGREWCEQQLLDLGLAILHDAGTIRLTNSGRLLLTNEPRLIAPGAWIEVRRPGRPLKAIDGNLWEQYEGMLALLEENNRPIRMKGSRSETVRPYAEEAIKEVIANALVHRNYFSSDPIVLSLQRDAIRIDSPGGIEEGLLRRLLGDAFGSLGQLRVPSDVLQRRIEHGDRGTTLTAYRNPVLADLFYGTGIVDKAGSGLADALDAMEALGGRLLTEVTEDNGVFRVSLIRRPARVDTRTRTARPVRPTVQLHTNLIEVLDLPQRVWTAPSSLRRPPDPAVNRESRDWPRFVCYDGRLYTFSDLSNAANPLRATIDSADIRTLDTASFATGDDGQRRLVHLLHEVLFQHLARQGVQIDWDNKRGYYTCARGGARYIKYQARVHASNRRVAWWPGKERIYCVHKAAFFHFERFGDRWVLCILPTYVFTHDGIKDRIRGREASSLATRHSTEDYNVKVSADVFFWRAILAGKETTLGLDAGLGAYIRLASTPATTLARPAIPERRM